MTAPENGTPDSPRAWMTDDPKLKGIVLLMLDRLSPALHHARGFGRESFPDDTEFAQWMNGAIFGTVATLLTTNQDEVRLDEITKVYACISDVITETLDRYHGFNLDQLAQDLLVRLGEMTPNVGS